MPGSTILEEAAALVTDGQRARSYGPPVAACEQIATVWSALTGHRFRPADVPLLLAAVKLCRQAHRHGRDNLVDLAGYALIADMAAASEEES